jgi:hypothetical protein
VFDAHMDSRTSCSGSAVVSRSCPGGERIVDVVPGVRAELDSGKDSAVKDG